MINNKILKQALLVINQKHKNADNLTHSNLEYAMKNREFMQNYQKLREAEFENAKCEAYGQKAKFDTKQLLIEQEQILKTMNLKKQDLLCNYECKNCNDTGFVNNQICTCLKKEINRLLFEKSGFKRKLNSFSDCNFELFDNKQKMQTLYSTMQKWCTSDNQYKIILLSGPTGAGKTYLLECMANELINNNKIVYFSSAFNVNCNLLKFHTTFDNSKLEYLDVLLEPEYLFIDDLGTEPILKNVTVEGIYNIISDRLEHNKKTIISTNLNLGNIEDIYGERIFSRLVNKTTSLCFNVENSDIRLKNR